MVLLVVQVIFGLYSKQHNTTAQYLRYTSSQASVRIHVPLSPNTLGHIPMHRWQSADVRLLLRFLSNAALMQMLQMIARSFGRPVWRVDDSGGNHPATTIVSVVLQSARGCRQCR